MQDSFNPLHVLSPFSFHSDADRGSYTHFTNEDTTAEGLYKLPQITLLSSRARMQMQEVWYRNLTIIMAGLEFPDILFFQLSKISFVSYNVSLKYNFEEPWPVFLSD